MYQGTNALKFTAREEDILADADPSLHWRELSTSRMSTGYLSLYLDSQMSPSIVTSCKIIVFEL